MLYRSVAYWRVLCGDDFLLEVKQGGTAFRLGLGITDRLGSKAAGLFVPADQYYDAFLQQFTRDKLSDRSLSVLAGEQWLPADRPYEARILCVEALGEVAQ